LGVDSVDFLRGNESPLGGFVWLILLTLNHAYKACWITDESYIVTQYIWFLNLSSVFRLCLEKFLFKSWEKWLRSNLGARAVPTQSGTLAASVPSGIPASHFRSGGEEGWKASGVQL